MYRCALYRLPQCPVQGMQAVLGNQPLQMVSTSAYMNSTPRIYMYNVSLSLPQFRVQGMQLVLGNQPLWGTLAPPQTHCNNKNIETVTPVD